MSGTLPDRSVIQAIEDAEALEDILTNVDREAKKIEVDLEFRSDGDLDWERRARAALTAHYVCIGHIGRRIRALTRKNPVENPIEKIEAKARKHSAVAERQALEVRAREQKLEQQRIQTVNSAMHFAKRSSILFAFNQAAIELLGPDDLARINGRAGQIVAKNIVVEVSPSANVKEPL